VSHIPVSATNAPIVQKRVEDGKIFKLHEQNFLLCDKVVTFVEMARLRRRKRKARRSHSRRCHSDAAALYLRPRKQEDLTIQRMAFCTIAACDWRNVALTAEF
jgi:hypothetical protein